MRMNDTCATIDQEGMTHKKKIKTFTIRFSSRHGSTYKK